MSAVPNPVIEDWYPTELPQRAAWHSNFERRVRVDSSMIRFTLLEIRQIQLDVRIVHEAAAFMKATQKYIDTLAQAEIDVPRDCESEPQMVRSALAVVERRTRGFVRRIQELPCFTQEWGENYNILSGTEVLCPILSAIPCEQSPFVELQIRFGSYETVQIQSRVDGGFWEVIGCTSEALFKDDRRLRFKDRAETREYRAQGVQNGRPHGSPSRSVSAVVA